jgi:hypothetical protein
MEGSMKGLKALGIMYEVGGAFMSGNPQRNLKNNTCPGVPR